MIISCIFVFSILFSTLFSMLFYSTNDRVHLRNKKKTPFYFFKTALIQFSRHVTEAYISRHVETSEKKLHFNKKTSLHCLSSHPTQFFLHFYVNLKNDYSIFFFQISRIPEIAEIFIKVTYLFFVESSTITKTYSLLRTFSILRNYLLVT